MGRIEKWYVTYKWLTEEGMVRESFEIINGPDLRFEGDFKQLGQWLQDKKCDGVSPMITMVHPLLPDPSGIIKPPPGAKLK